MHELDVRRLLYRTELRRVAVEKPGTRIVNELVLLGGAARVDVAVINDSLSGYEIKSASDNLSRLPAQQAVYSRVFERMTLVADENHAEEAVGLVPPNWGLIVVGLRNGQPYANEIWPPIRNHQLDCQALAQLLWREEALELMEYFGLARGMRNKRRRVICKSLASQLSIEEVRAFVCYKLRTRSGWRGLRTGTKR